MSKLDAFEGSILGLAIGDALGHPTEFISSVDGIKARFGPNGIEDFAASGRHPAGTFTDDTQMAIAVARALVRSGGGDLEKAMTMLGEEFVAWARSPENNRAPGGTCMRGCRDLERGTLWRQAGVADSKGCGAAMRAAPVGLLFYDDTDALVRFSAAQSSLTHRHPTGIASSVAAAAPVAHVLRKGTLDGIIEFTRECVEKLDEAYLVSVGCTPELAASVGNREMLIALSDLEGALAEETDDVCKLLGGAWIGEEAVVTALWCVLKAKGDFNESVRRGANSSGDSDSIACIAGSISGALLGARALPQHWVNNVEKTAALTQLARALYATKRGELQLEPLPNPFAWPYTPPPPRMEEPIDEQ